MPNAMVPPKRHDEGGHQRGPAAVDIRGRFYALHAKIGDGGLEPLARMDLPRLERSLLSLMADFGESAYKGAAACAQMIAGTSSAKSRFRVLGMPVEPPRMEETPTQQHGHAQREEP